MKILSVSDIEISFLYTPQVATRFADVDLIISCGDLPYYYLEYVLSMLDVPLFFVRGNHHNQIEHGTSGERKFPLGGFNLNQRTTSYQGLLLAGIEGSLLYNRGPVQYSQSEYWGMVFQLIPRLLMNKLRYGRYLDIFVSHAPPAGIHDQEDRAHQGIRAFRWLINTFHPHLFLHGHVHVYRASDKTQTLVQNTWVVNTYGFREIEIQPGKLPAVMKTYG